MKGFLVYVIVEFTTASPPSNNQLPSSIACGGWGVAQSVERSTPGEEVQGLITAVVACSYWLGRCQYNVTG